jgi:hypothetical protein
MNRVKIVRRTVVKGRVWQGSQIYTVTDDELSDLIEAGAVELETAAAGPAPENKAQPVKRKRGRPRKVVG